MQGKNHALPYYPQYAKLDTMKTPISYHVCKFLSAYPLRVDALRALREITPPSARCTPWRLFDFVTDGAQDAREFLMADFRAYTLSHGIRRTLLAAADFLYDIVSHE